MDTNKKEFKALLVLIAVLAGVASLFFLAKTVNELKASKYIGPSGPEAHIISVSGEGEVFAVPDTARFTFTVFEEAETVDGAQRVVTETQNGIIEFLEGEGIPEEKIKTISYNIFPRYEFRNDRNVSFPAPEGRRVLVGYEVRHTIEVKVSETERAGELISGVTGLGANEVSGVSFTIEDEEAVRREARQKAIEDAQTKARQLADDLGVGLGPLVSFSEDGPNRIFMEARALEADDAIGEGGISPDIPAGENRIVVRVNLGYEIR